MTKVCVAGLASLAFAGAAVAQEGLPEGMRWGWTQEQLLAASPDIRPVRRGDEVNGARSRAEGPVSVGALDLKAKYYFNDIGLNMVTVRVPYRKCSDALTTLVGRYGEPLIIDDQIVLKLLIWHDDLHETRPVLMVSPGGICSLTLYRLAEYRDHDLTEVAAGHARPPS